MINVIKIGSGIGSNLINNFKQIPDVIVIEYNSVTLSSLLSFVGTPKESPLLLIGTSTGLSGPDLQELNRYGFILFFCTASVASLSSLNPSVSFTRYNYNYTITTLDVQPNDYFEYCNYPNTKIPVFSNTLSYYLLQHSNLVPILYLGQPSDIRLGVIEKLQTNNGIMPTPMLYGQFLSDAYVNENTKAILKDIILFAKNNTNPPYNVSGLVLDFNKEPIDRDIAVYSTTTNKLVGKSRSKEDGTYWVGLTKDEPVYVVAIPEENNNALIKYNIKPVPSY